ncbi:MAG: CocE/NonD family hydrolase [Dehalococcoidia bacterium]|nr:CocE/NonD family hydrolase [Dehalococcoidia bacterium]
MSRCGRGTASRCTRTYSGPTRPERFPVLLSRTPTGSSRRAANPNGSNQFFARYGYVTIMQDVRGRFASEGEYEPIFQEIADGYDAVEWAARLPWANGRVGTCGQSYLGLTQYTIACNEALPPSLQAMVPVSASSDHRESWVYHSGGAAMWGWMVPYAIFKGRNTLERAGRSDLLAQMDAYVEEATNFSQPTAAPECVPAHRPIADWVELLKEAAPYFGDHVAHPDDGPYWHRANLNRHAATVNVPMLHVSSWYDIFAEGAVNAFRSIRERSQDARARETQRLIMGPWGHLFPYVVPTSGGTGDIDFGPEALVDLHETQLNWFDQYLKDDDTGVLDTAPVHVFVMGENRWRALEDWPPPEANPVRFYLHSNGNANSVAGDGTLSTVPPADEAADAYTYDPDDPVPTRGGANLAIPLGVQDQRPVEERQDVLVFTSEPLEQPLEVIGPVTVELWASSSAPRTRTSRRSSSMYTRTGMPGNLLDGIIRARYRDSASDPSPIEPDRAYRYTIDLWNTANTFLPGHRIRLEISSSNFPRFDVNLNTGEPFGQGVTAQPARQTVYHRAGMASSVRLHVMPR